MVSIPLRYYWHDPIFQIMINLKKSTTFSAPFLRSLLQSDTKILRTRIYFRLKTTDIDNQYYLYSRICADGSSMLEGVDFTVSYAKVAVIRPLSTIIAILYEEVLIIFVLYISNAFHNKILPNSEEMFYLSLPRLCIEFHKRKWLNHPLASINKKDLFIQVIKLIQGIKPAGKLWYDLLK